MTATVTVTGNVGQDPEIRYTQTGKAVCTLSVAATPRKQTPAGEWDDDGEPLWIRADFWERDAETVADAVRRGDRITIAGKPSPSAEPSSSASSPAPETPLRLHRSRSQPRTGPEGTPVPTVPGTPLRTPHRRCPANGDNPTPEATTSPKPRSKRQTLLAKQNFSRPS